MPLLGAHQSIAGGLHLAFDRIRRAGGESLQIFTANQRQWWTAPLLEEEILLFRQKWEENHGMPVAAHTSYLINLATAHPDKAAKSVAALVDELQRCRQLGITMLIMHPGSHGGAGVERGLEAVAAHLDLALEQSGGADSSIRVLLETTAGQGTSLGSSFEELAWLIGRSRYPERLGVCVDTCHIFAAGYDVRTRAEYDQTLDRFDRIVGCGQIFFFHLNDSRKELGSRVDRHEHIGQGAIGLNAFRMLLNDSRFVNLPMTLETPKEEDLREDRENLARLRALIR
ncbi:deoxyribonuclease IV [Desulfobulbus alkaliphilus]|uniref:deoxyribonuclease IV n=1 Tax=Desulfobulbus alkaliphilus TaxID=869814 RepID=UPI001964167E|nr:deoxyribonuclease IV [Desulfobulbus alkaliphilus]MBM9537317.1 deoxyribonuclease IV [Desulfobulbus alkaliphilus]